MAYEKNKLGKINFGSFGYQMTSKCLNKFGIIAFIFIYSLLLLEVYFHRYEKPSAFTFFILKDIELKNRWVELDNMGIFKSRFFSMEFPGL